MAGPGYVKDRGIRGLQHTDKTLKMGGASWVEPTGGVVFFDDFLGDTLATDHWLSTVTDGTDTTGTGFTINASAGAVAGHGGWVRATQVAPTDANSAAELGFGANGTPASGFRSDRAGNGMLVFESRVSLPTATEIRVNVGLSDDATEGLGLAASLATATFTTNATDAHLWLFDTAATTDVFQGISVSGGTDSSGSIAGATGQPTAATAYRLRIEVDASANSYWYIDDVYKGVQVADNASASTILLTPYLGLEIASSATGGLSFDVDYVLVGCGR